MAYIYDLSDTWDSAGTTFYGIKLNVTNSASATTSRLMSLQIGGTEKASVDKDGLGYFTGGIKFGDGTTQTTAATAIANTDSLTEGSTNLYFTNARARSAISASGSLSYNSSTGVISYTAPTLATVATSGAISDTTGTLAVNRGGTGQTSYTDGQLLIGNSTGNTLSKATLTAGSGISITNGNGSITIAATGGGGSGTVTSVDVSGGTTGLTFSGGPVTSSGTITMAGTLGVANGGTGATTLTSGRLLLGNGTSAVTASLVYDTGSGVGIGASPSAGTTLRIGASLTGGTTAIGAYNNQAIQSDVTNTAQLFSTYVSTAAASFTLGTLFHFNAGQNTIGAGSAVTSQVGFYAQSSLTGATNNYGFYGNIASGTGRWNLYMGGTAQNYFAGNVGIGTSAPVDKLQVEGNLYFGTSNRVIYAGGAANLTLQTSTGVLAFNTGGSVERMRIDSSGNLLVGTTTATALLTVNGTSYFAGSMTSGNLADAVGYKGLPQNSQTSSYTISLPDMGKHISITTGGIVIPANGTVAFPIGATVVVFNNSGSTQVISITSDTLRQAGTSNTGSRTLAAYGLATLVKVGSTTWVVTGNVT